MKETDKYLKLQDILKISKNLGYSQNVSFRVLDAKTGELVSEHKGHNSATNSLITGIAHYLIGEGTYNQGWEMLHKYIPLFISLGTMGLINQEEDEEGLPAGVGVMPDWNDTVDDRDIAILNNYEEAVKRLDTVENGFQAVDKYGDIMKDDDGNPRYETDLTSYIYPPDNSDEPGGVKDTLLRTWGYKPEVDHCIYFVDMIDKGQRDEHGNVVLEPDLKPTGEPNWSIAKGVNGLVETIESKRQCPYFEESVTIDHPKCEYFTEDICPYFSEDSIHLNSKCLLHSKCLEYVFPEKRVLIELLQSTLDSWEHDYTNAKEGYYIAYDALEELRFDKYLDQCPGYGADGSCENGSLDNNFRPYFGLGPMYPNRENASGLTVDCELISERFPREPISYREIVPEHDSELKNTVDIIFSAMISTGALKQFREPGKDYVFITEAGLWASPEWNDSGENGLLAGYRIVPPNSENWDMSKPENRRILKENILKVGLNQVVQVVWKIQIGGVDQFEGMRDIFSKRDWKYSAGTLFGHIPTHIPYDRSASINIDTLPTKLVYQPGEQIDLSGIVINRYNLDKELIGPVDVNDVSYYPSVAENTSGEETVVVSWSRSDDKFVLTDSFDIMVQVETNTV